MDFPRFTAPRLNIVLCKRVCVRSLPFSQKKRKALGRRPQMPQRLCFKLQASCMSLTNAKTQPLNASWRFCELRSKPKHVVRVASLLRTSGVDCVHGNLTRPWYKLWQRFSTNFGTPPWCPAPVLVLPATVLNSLVVEALLGCTNHWWLCQETLKQIVTNGRVHVSKKELGTCGMWTSTSTCGFFYAQHRQSQTLFSSSCSQPKYRPCGSGSSISITEEIDFQPFFMFFVGPAILRTSTNTTRSRLRLGWMNIDFQTLWEEAPILW